MGEHRHFENSQPETSWTLEEYYNALQVGSIDANKIVVEFSFHDTLDVGIISGNEVIKAAQIRLCRPEEVPSDYDDSLPTIPVVINDRVQEIIPGSPITTHLGAGRIVNIGSIDVNIDSRRVMLTTNPNSEVIHYAQES